MTWAAIDERLSNSNLAVELNADIIWHLDNAGSILISMKDIDPRPVGTERPDPEDPEFTLVPVPVGHKVILQR